MIRTPDERALIVDVGSIHARLMGWRHRGEFEDADEVMRLFCEAPDRWLRAVGVGRPEGAALTLRDFDRRTLVLPRTDDSVEPKLIEQLQWIAATDSAYRNAVDRFEQFGFRIVVSAAEPSMQLSIEVMRMLRERALPTEVVIATASPQIAEILPVLRSLGVRVDVVAVMSRRETRRLYELVDSALDVKGLTDALGLGIVPGFAIRNATHRRRIYDKIVEILGKASLTPFTIDGLRSELQELSSTVDDNLPREDGGLRELLEDLLEERKNDKVLSSYRLTTDRLIPVQSLIDTAEQLKDILKRVPREGNTVRLTYIADELLQQQSAVGDGRWLGYESFRSFLEAVLDARPNYGWRVDAATAPACLVVPEGSLPDLVRTETRVKTTDFGREDRGEVLRQVAEFVDARLRDSEVALPLVDLANEVPSEVDGASSGNAWLGHGTFLTLLRAASQSLPDADWIFETQVSPGYVRLASHRRPTASSATFQRYSGAGARVGVASTAPVRPAIAKLRDVVQDFPNDTVEEVRLRIAIMATVIASVTPATAFKERFGLALRMQGIAERIQLRGGRGSFRTVMRSVRTASFAEAGPDETDATGRPSADESVDHSIEHSLVDVGLMTSVDPLRLARAPEGAARLHEIMWHNMSSLVGRSLLDEEAETLIDRVLGPVARPQTEGGLRLLVPDSLPKLLERYARFCELPGNAPPEDPQQLMELMRRLHEDRRAFLQPTNKLDDVEAVRADLEQRIESLLAGENRWVPLDELFDHVSDASPIADRATLFGLLLDLVANREGSDVRPPWTLDLRLPPGALGIGSREPEHPSWPAGHAWLGHTRRFAVVGLLAESRPIGWAEASWVIAQYHGLTAHGSTGADAAV